MRDDFGEATKLLLARRVGFRCSNPKCRKPTSGPQEDPDKTVNIGVAAHITAASPGGPRYDPSLTSEQRQHSDNGIWLCQSCAKLVDSDPARYSVALLRRWKAQAEQTIRDEIESSVAPTHLDDYLARAVAAYEARMYQRAAWAAKPPKQPYKFLYPFEFEDAGIFFGRKAAAEALHQTVLKDRLTVLHARSGMGKTSLLNAGLSPHLVREARLPVSAHAYKDPVHGIKLAIAPPALAPWPDLLAQLPLHEFLSQACAHLSPQTRELVLILDQFEQFFVFWPERDHRQPFIDALADCYEDKTLPVRLVIGIRGDFFTHLATFDNRFPCIYHNQYYLGAMTRQEVAEAITRPAAGLKQAVIYDSSLLNTLLNDLARGGMELPHLQVICEQMYNGLADGRTTITLADYEALGRAEGILGRYLQDVLNRLPGKGSDVAKAVLSELVSSEATMRVMSYGSLTAKIEAETKELDEVLTRLVEARLLRRDEVAGKVIYEMAHEYLIREIGQWLDQADRAFKQAEELLAREVASWQTHGALIPRDRLELLHEHDRLLRGLDEVGQNCVFRSALVSNFKVTWWLDFYGIAAAQTLIAALADENYVVRRAAVNALGSVGDPAAVQPLIDALFDEDSGVRKFAADALGSLRDLAAVQPLIDALTDKDSNVRRSVAYALGSLGDVAAAQPFIAALADEDRFVRRYAADALGRLGDTAAVQRLIAALGDEDGDVRYHVAEALGRLGDPAAVRPLIAALVDQDRFVRRYAAEALGKLRASAAVQPLVGALDDQDNDVRHMAGQALQKIGTPEALDALKESGM